MPELKTLDDPRERFHFGVTKVSSWLASQGVAGDSQKAQVQTSFVNQFHVPESEKVISCKSHPLAWVSHVHLISPTCCCTQDYACAYQRVNQGWMYISQNYLCFYAFLLGKETKIVLQHKDIEELERDGVLRDGIRIGTKGGRNVSLQSEMPCVHA